MARSERKQGRHRAKAAPMPSDSSAGELYFDDKSASAGAR
jgi:hypothetical protein